MTLDPTIGLGSMITLAVLLLGGVGGYYTLKAVVSTMGDELKKMAASSDAERVKHGTHHDENQKRMAAIELQIAKECVQVEDFRRMDDRMNVKFDGMNQKFDALAHSIANSSMKTAQLVKEMLRPRDRDRGDDK